MHAHSPPGVMATCRTYLLQVVLSVSQPSAGLQLLLMALQVVATLVAVAGTAMALANVSGPGAVILGGGLALSSTAVAMQVLQDRGESGSRHGRATFAVLLLQVSTFCYREWQATVCMPQPFCPVCTFAVFPLQASTLHCRDWWITVYMLHVGTHALPAARIVGSV